MLVCHEAKQRKETALNVKVQVTRNVTAMIFNHDAEC